MTVTPRSPRQRNPVLGQLPPITRADGSPIRVLLVDDEPALTNLLKMALHYEGWHIEVAADETATRPMTAVEVVNSGWRGSVWGKFKYAADLDCYVGMQHSANGDVWLWRPPGWADPRGV